MKGGRSVKGAICQRGDERGEGEWGKEGFFLGRTKGKEEGGRIYFSSSTTAMMLPTYGLTSPPRVPWSNCAQPCQRVGARGIRSMSCARRDRHGTVWEGKTEQERAVPCSWERRAEGEHSDGGLVSRDGEKKKRERRAGRGEIIRGGPAQQEERKCLCLPKFPPHPL